MFKYILTVLALACSSLASAAETTSTVKSCAVEGKEVQTARGASAHPMQKAEWDLRPYAGKKMFLKIVDQSTGGWGHLTVDNFQFDGVVLDKYPQRSNP